MPRSNEVPRVPPLLTLESEHVGSLTSEREPVDIPAHLKRERRDNPQHVRTARESTAPRLHAYTVTLRTNRARDRNLMPHSREQ